MDFCREARLLPLSRVAAAANQVTDLGSVLHLIGGTVAAFIIFFLPGLMLVNAAIVKGNAPSGPTDSSNIQDLEVLARTCIFYTLLPQ